MIGLDTNVLVRLLTGDDAGQQRLAAAYIEKSCSAENPALINRVVVIEFVWVLESVYGYSRAQIADAVERMLRTTELRFEDHETVHGAVGAYRNGMDFADVVIAETNRIAGCRATATFDERAAKGLSSLELIRAH